MVSVSWYIECDQRTQEVTLGKETARYRGDPSLCEADPIFRGKARDQGNRLPLPV